MNEALAAELRAMVEQDQRIRRRPPAQATKFFVPISPEQAMESSRVDVAIRIDFGRSSSATAGRVARSSERMALSMRGCLAQHSDRQLDFQRHALSLLAEAVTRPVPPIRSPKGGKTQAGQVRERGGRPQQDATRTNETFRPATSNGRGFLS